jgi:hypothetical protein
MGAPAGDKYQNIPAQNREQSPWVPATREWDLASPRLEDPMACGIARPHSLGVPWPLLPSMGRHQSRNHRPPSGSSRVVLALSARSRVEWVVMPASAGGGYRTFCAEPRGMGCNARFRGRRLSRILRGAEGNGLSCPLPRATAIAHSARSRGEWVVMPAFAGGGYRAFCAEPSGMGCHARFRWRRLSRRESASRSSRSIPGRKIAAYRCSPDNRILT